MAEVVVEALLSATFQKLFEQLTTVFSSFFREKESSDNQLNSLNQMLENAHSLLNDAEGKQITDEKVKKWLDDLNDVIFRAQDLVEDINAEARSKSVTPSTEFENFVRGEMGNILESLDFLLKRAGTLGLKHIDGAPNTRSSQISPAPFLEGSHVYGRDDEKKEILELLGSDEYWGDKIGVLPIVGMGGLGKTTLAQFVYDDATVKESFQHRAWVTVSAEFNIFKITETILRKVSTKEVSGVEELRELQERLTEALRGKKFFLVLDDVWEENYGKWDSLTSAFRSGHCRSRIIVTTRSQEVASMVLPWKRSHQLRLVSNDDCWKIFLFHAGDSDVDPCLKEIGREIVRKCKGIPLAVRSLAGHLRGKRDPETWKRILISHVWSKKLRNGILPALWLSYCCLSSRLKQCFSYCSIFPKEYRIEKEETIWFWMAEGFLESDEEGKTMEEVGKEYFDELEAKSLLQRSSRDESTFVMHDLVHDLAMFVSREFCFRFDHDTDLKHLSKKTRHISYRSLGDHKLWKGLFEANRLRTFTGNRYGFRDTELVEEVLGGGRHLRVLSLPPVIEIRLLMDSFSNLKHLRYLNISGSFIKELPCSICSLYNLQTLLLSNCEILTSLPTDMGRLTNLRHLDITKTPLIKEMPPHMGNLKELQTLLLSDCRRLTSLPTDLGRLTNLRHLDTTATLLKEMPPHMGNLKELQTLTSFVLGENGSGSSVKELGALQNLRGKLSISGLQNVESVEEAQEANLRDKDKLRELTLEWEGDVTDTRREKEVLDALKPHPNLSKLEIRRYAASSFPDWVGDSLLLNLESVRLTGNGDFCHALPPLGQLPSLQELVIKSFHGVDKIGPEFYTGNSTYSITPFQRLEFLWFSDMKSWKEWSFIGQDGKEDGCFPRLKELRLYRCPNLAGSLPKCDAIESLEIWGNYKLMESLPLDNFPKLKKLLLWECESLKELIVDSPDVIETLDVVDCNKLEFPGSHHYEHVKDLKFWNGCDSMKTLPLDYFPRLKKLNLKGCQNLESLTFTEETCIALRFLYLGDCKNLRSFPEHMHRLLPSLSEMNVQNCPEIEAFPKGGLPSNLNELSIGNCCKLVAQRRHWNLQGLTSLRSLRIRGCDEDIMLDSFPEGSLPSSLTSLNLEKLPHLKSLNGSAFQNVTCLKELELRNCEELQLLPREVLQLTSLRSLLIIDCPFLERRYQKGKGEDWHQISHIPIMHIGDKMYWGGKTTDELERNKEEGSTSTNV